MPTRRSRRDLRTANASAAPIAGTQEGDAAQAVVPVAVTEPPLTRRRLRTLAAAPEAPEAAAAPFTAPLQIVEQTAQASSADEESPAIPAAPDEFALAAQALNFTGAAAIPRAAVHAAPSGRGAVPPETGHVAPRRGRGSAFRRLVAATASVGAMGAIGLLAVGMTTPMGAMAQSGTAAVANVSASAQSEKLEDDEIQAFVASSEVHNADVERSQGYETQTFADIASASGVSTNGAFFTNDPHADIQWPFIVGTSMSSGFGPRWGRLHEGVDFTPGEGAPIQVVADGVVRTATESGGAYGVNVYVDHVIDGKVVTTHYAHMQYGSLKVVDGQRVEVGDTLGLVGNTGRSYGAHLHFEVIVNGSAIDPLPWLDENANTRYSDDEAAEADAALTELLGASTASE